MNAEVARIFEEVADLLEFGGADSFRVNSYRRVARTLAELDEDVRGVAARGALDKLPGVGKASAQKIEEILTTGRLTLLEELRAEVPPTLLALRAVPSLGPKKIAQLWRERGITSLDDLRTAIAAGRLAGLKGFGARTIEQIARGLEFIARCAGRVRLGTAAELAGELRAALAQFAGVLRVEVAGSLRRGRETVGDLDLLCVAEQGEAVVRQFAALACVEEVLAAGVTKGAVRVGVGRGQSLQVDLRVVPAESFGAAWQYFTGSQAHNVRLRERALRRGWNLSEYGLTEGERVIAARTEEEIYAALGLPWIPPELREDHGEFELCAPPRLLETTDLQGDLHMHTPASDGHSSIEELAAAAAARGYHYICITEHSQSSTIANGLKPERLRRHIADVRAAASRIRGCTVWVGTEVDILADGRLDYPDDLLAELDFVIASIHSGLSGDGAANTRRTLAAIENPYVAAIGHPTGRIINERDAMPLDIDAVIQAAARTGTALEINANDHRLDLKDQHARRARELGATVVINTDAHHTAELEHMHYGVVTARRGGLGPEHVLNTRAASEVAAFVHRKRAATKR